MKIKALWVLLLVAVFTFISCGSDDESEDMVETTDDEVMTDDGEAGMAALIIAQEMTTEFLTGGDAKVWRISDAQLNNSTGTIDISDNFNVVDDEFVFSGTSSDGELEWRQGNAIGVDGATSEETLLDFYKSPVVSSFSFDVDSSTNLSGLDGELIFEVVDENTITGVLTFNEGRSAGETMDFSLTTKMPGDYAAPPSNGLSFSESAVFNAYGNFSQESNVGLVGSYSDNSLFIAYRDDCDVNNERSVVLKYDVDNNSFVENRTEISDFFTRKVNVVNNELVLTGGTKIYTYDLDLQNEPSIIEHNAGNLSRFSTAVTGNNVYVVGGDLDEPADKLRKINSNSGALDIVASLPSPKVHAGSEIVNDKLYIFSGRGAFFENSSVTTESFIYDLGTGDFLTFNTPVPLSNSFASRFENLIYVVGDIQTDIDGDGTTDDYTVWAGVYDIQTGELEEIEHNLDDSDQFSFVQTMTVFNNKMYVIYGERFRSDPNDNCALFPWSIMTADLN